MRVASRGAADFVSDVMDLPERDGWLTKSAAAVRAAGNDRNRVIAALTSSLKHQRRGQIGISYNVGALFAALTNR